MPWLAAHALGISRCLDLLWYLQYQQSEPAGSGLSAYLRTLQGTLDGVGVKGGELGPLVTFGAGPLVRSANFLLGSPTETAIHMVAHIINSTLDQQRVRLEAGENGKFFLVYGVRSLVEVAYWHLARIATGDIALRRCQRCGAPFPESHGRQRFCPPEGPGSEGRESACARQERSQRFQARQAGRRQEGQPG